jgi:DNA anti-recombination protein RmuC
MDNLEGRIMSEKNLGESLENAEAKVEELKNKEFRVLGIKVSFMSVSALVAVLGSVIGTLYFGFTMYQKIEEVANLDVGAFEQRMEVIETKLDEAIDYTRDIKSGLRDDILSIEKQVDRVEDNMRKQEGEVRDIIQNAEERFENKRDALQNDYDEKANRLAERNDSRITDMETKVERDLKDLEDRLNKKLQRALDNPLAN